MVFVWYSYGRGTVVWPIVRAASSISPEAGRSHFFSLVSGNEPARIREKVA